jgi:hypothetical protein
LLDRFKGCVRGHLARRLGIYERDDNWAGKERTGEGNEVSICAKGWIEITHLRTRCKSPCDTRAMRSIPVTSLGQGYCGTTLMKRECERRETYTDARGLCVVRIDAGGHISVG